MVYPTGFKINGVDFNDVYVRAEYFTAGGLWIWGRGNESQLGDNTIVSKASPVQTVSGGTNWRQVNTGLQHTAAIKTDGTLWLWGRNSDGRLGDNTIIDRSSPIQTVSSGTNWRLVASGWYHTGAIKTDGTLWIWGRNNNGQLGDNTSIWRSSPVQTVSGGASWNLVAGGFYHTAAIKTDGTLWTWGRNLLGQLGNNATTNLSSPVQTISAGTNWKQVAAGWQHTVAIKTDGTLWAWGHNGNNGALGDNTTINSSSPVQTISAGTNWKQVTAGWQFTAAIKTDGTLWTWGYNIGNLGDNTSTPKSSPIQTVSGGTNWKLVTAGRYHTATIKTDGTLWTWGLNNNSQLGDNSTTSRSSPVQTTASGTNWKQVDSGGENTATIRDQW